MLRLALLGLISGFPWVLIGSALSLWLKEEGAKSDHHWMGRVNFYGLRF